MAEEKTVNSGEKNEVKKEHPREAALRKQLQFVASNLTLDERSGEIVVRNPIDFSTAP